MKNLIFSILLFFFSAFISQAQNIAVKSFQQIENDMDARVNFPKRDQNGEVCAIIKVVTNQTGFDWEPDGLGIVAVERKTGEYWLYVPRGARRLTIKHDQLGVLRNYQYPIPIRSSTVYILDLYTAPIEKDEIVESKTKTVLISTKPLGADVYVNNKLLGTSPLEFSLIDTNEFSYRIEKNRFYPLEGTQTIPDIVSNFSFELNPNYRVKRYFSAAHFGMNSLIIEDSRNSSSSFNFMFGFTLGVLGGTGYYASTSFSYSPIQPDFLYVRETDSQIPNERTVGYYYTNPGITILDNSDRFNLFRLSGGLTQQISKKTFFMLGMGYSQRKFFKVFIKEPYDLLDNTGGQTAQQSGSAYGLVLDESFRGFNLDMGLVKRFGSSILVSFNFTANYRLSTLSSSKKYMGFHQGGQEIAALYPDIKIGLGYLF